jgi:toluene monooxygenase system protein E
MSYTAAPLKTYSHLAGQRRMPSEYEVVTSQLLYHPAKGFEVVVPAGAWYQRYQREARLGCSDWEQFQDPRQTTYAAYTALQSKQETHLAGVLHSWEGAEHDPALAAASRQTFARVMGPLRFPLHGFQMIAAYVGQMAPSGRIAVAALFQSADELRRVHQIAYHMAQLGLTQEQSRADWQSGAAWQPLRRAVERALVAYDWGEALVALDLCLKPLCEQLFCAELARLARQRQDFLLGEMLGSFEEDGRWHRSWSGALVQLAVSDRPENAAVLQDWVGHWYPAARAAALSVAELLDGDGPRAFARAENDVRQWLASLGLVLP